MNPVSVDGVIQGKISRLFSRPTMKYSWTNDNITYQRLVSIDLPEDHVLNGFSDTKVKVVLGKKCNPLFLTTIDDKLITGIRFDYATPPVETEPLFLPPQENNRPTHTYLKLP